MRILRGVTSGALVLSVSAIMAPATAVAAPSIPSYNALVTSSGAIFAPSSLHFDAVAGDVTAAKTVTFTSTGPDPVTFETATLGGTSPSTFTITADTCSTQTLDSGLTCTIDITALAPVPGDLSATLDLADNSGGAAHSVPLSVTTGINARGTYYPFPPQRIMDTRTGNGTTKAPIGSNGIRHLQVTGRGTVPASGVSAVVLNVTVVAPASSGYLTVYPTGVTRPTASSLNFAKGWTGANSVTVAVGTGGQVDIFNASTSANVIVDVAGFYAANNNVLSGYGLGGQFQPVYPERLFDSRNDWGFPLPTDYFVSSSVDYGDTINSHIRAFAVNITAVSPTGSGYLTAWDGGDTFPSTSTLNFGTGQTVPNMAIVPAGPCWICEGAWYGKPSISVYTSRTTHLLIDIVGFFDDSSIEDGLRFTPITPTRITDTRTSTGLPGPLASHATGIVTTPDSVISEPNTEALALNVTAVSPTASTWLTVWPSGDSVPMPTVSNLNPAKGQTVANAVITGVGPTNAFSVYNQNGTTQVLIDVVGTYWLYPGTASASGFAGPGVVATGPSLLRTKVMGGVLHQR